MPFFPESELNYTEFLLFGLQSGITIVTGNETDQAESVRSLATNFKRVPGFFTPYRSFGDFASTLTSPIVAPLAFSIVSGLTLIAAGIGLAATAGSLLVAGFSGATGVFSQDALETAKSAFGFAVIAGIFSGICALISLAAAVIATITLPLALATIITRSAATLLSPCIACQSDTFGPEPTALQPSMSL